MQLSDDQVFVVTRVTGERGAVTILIIDSRLAWQIVEIVFPRWPQARRRLAVERRDLPKLHFVAVPGRRGAVDAVQIQCCGAGVSYSAPNFLERKRRQFRIDQAGQWS